LERLATYDEICSRARELGLELCPAEVGHTSDFSMKPRPSQNGSTFGMQPVMNSSGRAADGGHADPRTTKLYDRRGDDVSLDDVERISF
jgi:hypothetical protein